MDKEYTPAEAKAWLAGYDAGKAYVTKEWKVLTESDMNHCCAQRTCSNRNLFFRISCRSPIKPPVGGRIIRLLVKL